MLSGACSTQFDGAGDNLIIDIFQSRPFLSIFRITFQNHVQISITGMAEHISDGVFFIHQRLRKENHFRVTGDRYGGIHDQRFLAGMCPVNCFPGFVPGTPQLFSIPFLDTV